LALTGPDTLGGDDGDSVSSASACRGGVVGPASGVPPALLAYACPLGGEAKRHREAAELALDQPQWAINYLYRI
jgi:hypothetical protein